MNLSNFNPKTFPLNTSKNGKIDSEKLNAFSSAASIDLAAISSLLNDHIIKAFNSLPSTFNPSEEPLDGRQIYLNADAKDKDNNIFYHENPTDSGKSRPLTIYEAMLLFLQILTNIENGMREGIKVGSFLSKTSISSSGGEVSFPWVYADHVFEPILFEESGNQVKRIDPSEISVYIDTSSNQLKIVNNTGSSKQIWGYVWHPVLSF